MPTPLPQIPITRVRELFERTKELHPHASSIGVPLTVGDVASLCNEVLLYREHIGHVWEVSATGGQASGAELGLTGQTELEQATKRLADVGFTPNAQQADCVAIVQVANMLAELMEWRRDDRHTKHVEMLLKELHEWRVGKRLHMTNAQRAALERTKNLTEVLTGLGWKPPEG